MSIRVKGVITDKYSINRKTKEGQPYAVRYIELLVETAYYGGMLPFSPHTRKFVMRIENFPDNAEYQKFECGQTVDVPVYKTQSEKGAVFFKYSQFND